MIKDFIKVFKETYNKYNKDKLDAKNCLDLFKTIISTQKENTDKLYNLSTTLANCRDIIPYHVYIDYYKKTLNYLKFGNDIKYNDDGGYSITGGYKGFIEFMESLCESMAIEYYIATTLHKDKNYVACIERVKNAINKFNAEWKEFDADHKDISQVQED